MKHIISNDMFFDLKEKACYYIHLKKGVYMKVTEVDNSFKYAKAIRPCGFGTTSICFLTADKKVLKHFIDTPRTAFLFKTCDMLERLKEINSIQNTSFHGPEEVLVKQGKVIGYLYPYVVGRTVKHLNRNISLLDFYKSIKKLLVDIEAISDKNFLLSDVHFGNIIYNGDFHIIDLDWGCITNDYTLDQNCKRLISTIIYSLFKVDIDDNMIFKKKDINDIFNNIYYSSDESIYKLFEVIMDYCNNENPTIGEVRNKIKVRSEADIYKFLK